MALTGFVAGSAEPVWTSLGGLPGTDAPVRSITVDPNGNVYVTGDFFVAGSKRARRIARWDGTEWSAMGNGLDGPGLALEWIGDRLYAGLIPVPSFSGVRNPPILVSPGGGGAWNPVPLPVTQPSEDGLLNWDGRLVSYRANRDSFGEASWIQVLEGTTWRVVGPEQFTTAFTHGFIASAASVGTNLYLGGNLRALENGPKTHRVLRHEPGITRVIDGQIRYWRALGGTMDGPITRLATAGTHLYVAGSFTRAGEREARGIARWDGANWAPLGEGIDGTVTAVATQGDAVYVAGSFRRAGNQPARNLAVWNGSTWAALGSGIEGVISDLAVHGSRLYAVGSFSRAGEVAAHNIAQWDGTRWSPLGRPAPDASVHAILWTGSGVYAGGDFETAGGVSAPGVARWNGSRWAPLACGLNGRVRCLVESGDGVVAGGDFTGSGDIPLSHVARWDGVAWQALGAGLNGRVTALAASGTNLFAGGAFSASGDLPVRNLARWTGSEWQPVGEGMDGMVLALATRGDVVFAGGTFTRAGSVPARRVARWDGSRWEPLGTGVNGSVYALALLGQDLFAAGWFTDAGGVAAQRIARWDGRAWSSLGQGLDGGVRALAVLGNDLYAGGDFLSGGGGGATNRIAKWDGRAWSSFDMGTDAPVFALSASPTSLYLGGDFVTVGGELVPIGPFGTGPPFSRTGAVVSSYAARLVIQPELEGARILELEVGQGRVRIRFQGMPGRAYRVERAQALGTGAIWETAGGLPLYTGDGEGRFEVTEPLSAGPARFYRCVSGRP